MINNTGRATKADGSGGLPLERGGIASKLVCLSRGWQATEVRGRFACLDLVVNVHRDSISHQFVIGWIFASNENCGCGAIITKRAKRIRRLQIMVTVLLVHEEFCGTFVPVGRISDIAGDVGVLQLAVVEEGGGVGGDGGVGCEEGVDTQG